MKKRFNILRFLLAGAFCSVPAFTHAHPVAYQGATGVMTWNQADLTDNWVTYSFRPDAALAARQMRMETPQGRMLFYAPQFDYLVKRWNKSNSQANIYVYGAFGDFQFRNKESGAGLGGAEADIESRKYFALIKYEKMWTRLGSNFSDLTVRLGIAPYEAEYNEIASWLMLEYAYHPALKRRAVLTPLIRFFYKSVLFETGVSTEADWMINFMFHF